MSLVQCSVQDDVAVLSIDNPPVNALSPGVPEGLADGIRYAAAEPRVRAIVIAGSGNNFIAGADIREFAKITSGERSRGSLLPLLREMEDCRKPVVMAIQGNALGGGLEVALAGHYRVAVANARLGQPEVKLGLIPGAGGTQRLPRLVGAAHALDLCVTGEPVNASTGLAYGLIDRILDGELLPAAIEYAREVVDYMPPKVRERSVPADPGLFRAARAEAQRRYRQEAVFAVIDAIEASTKLPFDEGCRFEQELFDRCLHSAQSKALIHVFFAERSAAKIPQAPSGTPVLSVQHVAIVGAGTMGAGIAMAFANAGFSVLLKDTGGDPVARAMERIQKHYQASVDRGKLHADAMSQRLSRIRPAESFDGFDRVDLAIEAVFEDLKLKKQLFQELEHVTRHDTMLATNTSSLDIDEMAGVTTRPHMVLGLHFFSPAQAMRLVEIVPGSDTSATALATAMTLAKRLGKAGVLAGNCRGFIGNRMFAAYRREAQFLVEEGAEPEQVDRALREFGMAMGPLAVGDLAGLDVGWRIRRASPDGEDSGDRQPKAEDLLCEAGYYGQKTGAGWYRYDGGRTPAPHPEAVRLVRDYAASAGIPQSRPSDQEIVERTLFALINEGARLLEDGCAISSGDIDVIYVNGYGFPAWRGGPMWYADALGLDRVARSSRAPAPLLLELANSGRTFDSLGSRPLRGGARR